MRITVSRSSLTERWSHSPPSHIARRVDLRPQASKCWKRVPHRTHRPPRRWMWRVSECHPQQTRVERVSSLTVVVTGYDEGADADEEPFHVAACSETTPARFVASHTVVLQLILSPLAWGTGSRRTNAGARPTDRTSNVCECILAFSNVLERSIEFCLVHKLGCLTTA